MAGDQPPTQKVSPAVRKIKLQRKGNGQKEPYYICIIYR
jgi:hypothetical protein